MTTGDAVAGNVDRTSVCQLNDADPAFCKPKIIRFIINPGHPHDHHNDADMVGRDSAETADSRWRRPRCAGVVVVDPGEVSTSVRGATLPVTGAKTDNNISLAGLLLGAGVFLVLVAALVPRRRATG